LVTRCRGREDHLRNHPDNGKRKRGYPQPLRGRGGEGKEPQDANPLNCPKKAVKRGGKNESLSKKRKKRRKKRPPDVPPIAGGWKEDPVHPRPVIKGKKGGEGGETDRSISSTRGIKMEGLSSAGLVLPD